MIYICYTEFYQNTFLVSLLFVSSKHVLLMILFLWITVVCFKYSSSNLLNVRVLQFIQT